MTATVICGVNSPVDQARFEREGFEFKSFGKVFVAIRHALSIQVYEDERVLAVTSGVVYLPSGFSGGFKDQARYLADEYLSGGWAKAAACYGHYFACIVDKSTGALHSFGDPMGGRRVFYKQSGESIVLSSKLRMLKDIGISSGKPNSEYQPFALVYGYYPFEQTIYEDIKRASKDNVITVSGSKFELLERPVAPAVARSAAKLERSAVIDELHDRLIEVVNASLRGVDRVAVLLGGFDSALVAALAAKAGKSVKAYTFQYSDSEFNQKNIDSVVNVLGIDHQWVEVNSGVIERGLRDFSSYFDRPTNWPNYVIQTKLLCDVAVADGAEVGLTGDGCDEIFLGYPGIYRGAKFFGGERTLPSWLVTMGKRVIGQKFLEARLGHVHRLVLRVISNMGFDQRTRLYLIFRIMDESTISHLYGTPTAELESKVKKVVSEVAASLPELPPTILAYEGRDHIVPNRLKLSGSMDGTGLPLLSPYLHPHVRSYVKALPEEMLRPTGEAKRTTLGKDILLEMAAKKKLLPHEVIYQPKHAAVDGPLDRWYEQNLPDTLRKLIGSSAAVKDKRFLDALLKEKPVDVYYRRNHSVDSITCHAASLLATSGAFFANK